MEDIQIKSRHRDVTMNVKKTYANNRNYLTTFSVGSTGQVNVNIAF